MWVVTHALELDGSLVPQTRLLNLNCIEILNYGFAFLMEGLDARQRAHIMASLEGRVGPGGGILVDDPDLPAELQGREAPSWWSESPENPFSDTFTVE